MMKANDDITPSPLNYHHYHNTVAELGDSILSQEEAAKAGGPGAGEAGEKQQQQQQQQQHHRRHHPFWPLHTEDFWGLLFTAVGLMIAAGGGIGGGGAFPFGHATIKINKNK
jgi:hypothetical protein